MERKWTLSWGNVSVFEATCIKSSASTVKAWCACAHTCNSNVVVGIDIRISGACWLPALLQIQGEALWQEKDSWQLPQTTGLAEACTNTTHIRKTARRKTTGLSHGWMKFTLVNEKKSKEVTRYIITAWDWEMNNGPQDFVGVRVRINSGR